MSEEKKHKSNSKLSPTIIIVIVIIALALFVAGFVANQSPAFPLQNSSKGDSQGVFDFGRENCRDEQIPYEATETYIDREPYQDIEYYTEYLNAQVIDRSTTTKFNFDLGIYAYAVLELKNIDDEAGWFTVIFVWETLEDGETEQDVRHYIEPDEIIEFEDIYDIDEGEDYQVFSNHISDPIEKSRQVTKYKDVQKTRTVTKYRTKEVCD